jgi:hypothetical protein
MVDPTADLVKRFTAEIAHAQLHMDPITLLDRSPRSACTGERRGGGGGQFRGSFPPGGTG